MMQVMNYLTRLGVDIDCKNIFDVTPISYLLWSEIDSLKRLQSELTVTMAAGLPIVGFLCQRF